MIKKTLGCVAVSSLVVIGILVGGREVAQAQSVLGNPATTVGTPGRFTIGIAAGSVQRYKFRSTSGSLDFIGPTRSLTAEIEDSDASFSGQQIYLQSAIGILPMADILVAVGAARIKDKDEFYNGAFGPALALGLRISPPSSGPVRIGLVIQSSYAKSRDDKIDGIFSVKQIYPDGSYSWVDASVSGKEELSIVRYDMLLGAALQNLTMVQPYLGLLYSLVHGTDKADFSGNGAFTHSPPPQTDFGPISGSWDVNFTMSSPIGGVVGFHVFPNDPFNVDVELQFGTQLSFMFVGNAAF